MTKTKRGCRRIIVWSVSRITETTNIILLSAKQVECESRRSVKEIESVNLKVFVFKLKLVNRTDVSF